MLARIREIFGIRSHRWRDFVAGHINHNNEIIRHRTLLDCTIITNVSIQPLSSLARRSIINKQSKPLFQHANAGLRSFSIDAPVLLPSFEAILWGYVAILVIDWKGERGGSELAPRPLCVWLEGQSQDRCIRTLASVRGLHMRSNTYRSLYYFFGGTQKSPGKE